MNTKTKNRIFVQMNANVTSVLSNVCGATLSHSVNGMSQPPKNSVDISALAVITFAYSAMKNIENFIALYSAWYPATSSDSASGRSNGTRFVSANAATMNTMNAIVQLSTFQCSPRPACCSTIRPSETFPARISTGIVDIPIEISYEIICALDRSPPRSEYLLFDDHPARTMPYTPSEAMARMNRKPIGI